MQRLSGLSKPNGVVFQSLVSFLLTTSITGSLNPEKHLQEWLVVSLFLVQKNKSLKWSAPIHVYSINLLTQDWSDV